MDDFPNLISGAASSEVVWDRVSGSCQEGESENWNARTLFISSSVYQEIKEIREIMKIMEIQESQEILWLFQEGESENWNARTLSALRSVAEGFDIQNFSFKGPPWITDQGRPNFPFYTLPMWLGGS